MRVLASAAPVIVAIVLAIVGRMIAGIGELTIPLTWAGAHDKWGDVVIRYRPFNGSGPLYDIPHEDPT
jgi:hypothetical protein